MDGNHGWLAEHLCRQVTRKVQKYEELSRSSKPLTGFSTHWEASVVSRPNSYTASMRFGPLDHLPFWWWLNPSLFIFFFFFLNRLKLELSSEKKIKVDLAIVKFDNFLRFRVNGIEIMLQFHCYNNARNGSFHLYASDVLFYSDSCKVMYLLTHNK